MNAGKVVREYSGRDKQRHFDIDSLGVSAVLIAKVAQLVTIG
jgi:hypothetical protein